jgi:hypothetical protein
MIPVLQVATDDPTARRFRHDRDHLVDASHGDVEEIERDLLGLVCRTASQDYAPRLWSAGCVDFQLTRGRLGVSL